MAINRIRKDLDSLKEQVKPVLDEKQEEAVSQLCDALIAFSRLPRGLQGEDETLRQIQEASERLNSCFNR